MASSIKKPFAAFDIDGTLIRWQLYHALADELARAGVLGAIEFEAVRTARRKWKQRTGDDAFQAYERTLVNLIDAAMSGIKVEDLQTACTKVIHEYKDQVYTFTRDLIVQLKEEGYLLFAISASQCEIVKLLADYYRLDDYGGSIYETSEGYFTGRKELFTSHRKTEYLVELVKKHGAIWENSIAVGDSESDIPMLTRVQQPIAFNPTRLLFEHAKSAGWRVVVERKNMVYDLKASNGHYLLA